MFLSKKMIEKRGESMATIHVQGADQFKKEVLESKKPVMVDFYADWCGPCKLAEPIMEKLSDEMVAEAKIIKIDVDAEGNRELAQQFQVRSIPTVMMFKNGEQVDSAIGFIGENGYRTMLTKSLAA